MTEVIFKIAIFIIGTVSGWYVAEFIKSRLRKKNG